MVLNGEGQNQRETSLIVILETNILLILSKLRALVLSASVVRIDESSHSLVDAAHHLVY